MALLDFSIKMSLEDKCWILKELKIKQIEKQSCLFYRLCLENHILNKVKKAIFLYILSFKDYINVTVCHSQWLLNHDTNTIKNTIRPFVIGRKSRFFLNIHLGAHASAGIILLRQRKQMGMKLTITSATSSMGYRRRKVLPCFSGQLCA